MTALRTDDHHLTLWLLMYTGWLAHARTFSKKGSLLHKTPTLSRKSSKIRVFAWRRVVPRVDWEPDAGGDPDPRGFRRRPSRACAAVGPAMRTTHAAQETRAG